jgi:hypothetical protein
MADANEIAFSALLERIGFDANTRAYIVAQGFTTATTFATLPFSSYDEMLKNVMKVPTAYAQGNSQTSRMSPPVSGRHSGCGSITGSYETNP